MFTEIGKQSFDVHAAPVQCYAMSADAISEKPRVAVQKQRGSPRRSAGLRSAGIAAGLLAAAGIWAAALWAWPDADSAPTASAPFVSGTQEQSALRSTPVSSIAVDSVTQAPPPQPPPTNNAAADSGSPALPIARDLPNIGVVLGRDQQAPSALQTMPEGVSAVIRGNQPSSGPQPTPDSGMAVVTGNRKPSPLQLTPDNGTIIIRGN